MAVNAECLHFAHLIITFSTFPFEQNWFHRKRKYRSVELRLTLPLPYTMPSKQTMVYFQNSKYL